MNVRARHPLIPLRMRAMRAQSSHGPPMHDDARALHVDAGDASAR